MEEYGESCRARYPGGNRGGKSAVIDVLVDLINRFLGERVERVFAVGRLLGEIAFKDRAHLFETGNSQSFRKNAPSLVGFVVDVSPHREHPGVGFEFAIGLDPFQTVCDGGLVHRLHYDRI